MRITSTVLPAAIFAIATMLGACNELGNSREASGRDNDVGRAPGSIAGAGLNRDVKGAPGPIAGAGLPILAVGCGIYWLVRRRRRAG
ncbi:hypothetical protein [Bosea thiooxidans]